MSETAAAQANDAQIDYWNLTAGPTWARFQAQLDRQIQGLGLAAMRALAPQAGEAVLDIGCGCGQTSVQLAALVGSAGSVTGVDISAPMLEVARRRPVGPSDARPLFREVDAQVGDLGAAIFDVAFSRFGVMFFEDPTAAFANIRKALKAGGRLAFVCWRPLAENPWMRAPMEAAAPFLPPMPPPDPLAPGPFAFADTGRVRSILADAGFGSIEINPHDAMIGSGDVDQTLELSFQVGPLGAALRENPDRAPAVREAVRAVLAPHHTAHGVLMPSATWIVQARNS